MDGAEDGDQAFEREGAGEVEVHFQSGFSGCAGGFSSLLLGCAEWVACTFGATGSVGSGGGAGFGFGGRLEEFAAVVAFLDAGGAGGGGEAREEEDV